MLRETKPKFCCFFSTLATIFLNILKFSVGARVLAAARIYFPIFTPFTTYFRTSVVSRWGKEGGEFVALDVYDARGQMSLPVRLLRFEENTKKGRKFVSSNIVYHWHRHSVMVSRYYKSPAAKTPSYTRCWPAVKRRTAHPSFPHIYPT